MYMTGEVGAWVFFFRFTGQRAVTPGLESGKQAKGPCWVGGAAADKWGAEMQAGVTGER